MRVAVAAVNQDGDGSGFIKFRQWQLDAIGCHLFGIHNKYSASKMA